MQQLYPVTEVLNETSAKVYTELKPHQPSLIKNNGLQQFLSCPSGNNKESSIITQESDFVYTNERYIMVLCFFLNNYRKTFF